jgi:predicted AAA+ superfamily ATPase
MNLYNYILSYLAKINKFSSLRELQKKLSSYEKISVKTTIDYIDYSLQAKIIKKIYNYNLKTKKIISSQAKYYFTDL